MSRASLVLILLPALLAGCVTRGGGSGSRGDDDDSAATVTDQLVLEVTDAWVVSTYSCAPVDGQPAIECADFDIDFTLTHGGDDPLERLDVLRVAGGAMEFVDNEDCAEAPFVIEPGDSVSGLLQIRYDGENGIPALYHRCGGSTAFRTNAAVGPAPTSGDLEVSIEVIGASFVHAASDSASLAFPN